MSEREAMQAFLGEMDRTLQQLQQRGERMGLYVAGIRIIASIDNLDGSAATTMASQGRGNFHAQMASVTEWLNGRVQYENGYHQARGAADFSP